MPRRKKKQPSLLEDILTEGLPAGSPALDAGRGAIRDGAEGLVSALTEPPQGPLGPLGRVSLGGPLGPGDLSAAETARFLQQEGLAAAPTPIGARAPAEIPVEQRLAAAIPPDVAQAEGDVALVEALSAAGGPTLPQAQVMAIAGGAALPSAGWARAQIDPTHSPWLAAGPAAVKDNRFLDEALVAAGEGGEAQPIVILNAAMKAGLHQFAAETVVKLSLDGLRPDADPERREQWEQVAEEYLAQGGDMTFEGEDAQLINFIAEGVAAERRDVAAGRRIAAKDAATARRELAEAARTPRARVVSRKRELANKLAAAKLEGQLLANTQTRQKSAILVQRIANLPRKTKTEKLQFERFERAVADEKEAHESGAPRKTRELKLALLRKEERNADRLFESKLEAREASTQRDLDTSKSLLAGIRRGEMDTVTKRTAAATKLAEIAGSYLGVVGNPIVDAAVAAWMRETGAEKKEDLAGLDPWIQGMERRDEAARVKAKARAAGPPKVPSVDEVVAQVTAKVSTLQGQSGFALLVEEIMGAEWKRSTSAADRAAFMNRVWAASGLRVKPSKGASAKGTSAKESK